ncbi:hypothetical protein Ddye_032318 [Dipteronia dyeriana]|uniref:DUF4218 domain-containing protein n=1 Tax=Dipteronia dyeriana TaxID=168575 RepID=A0AAD9TK61_9ROSI|nr:hypothetical protein Ddye_032318 [Dipteronia dyeriana]
MMHLPIHLIWEAKVAGPIQYKWMYPIERYLLKLNGYVRNMAQPEGSVAEGSSDEKKKGRRNAKGVPNNHNLEVHIYQGRIDQQECIKAKDVYSCCEGSCKRTRVDKTKELVLKIKNMEQELQQYKTMKDELEQLKATQEEVKQMCEFMRVMMSQSSIQLPPTTVFNPLLLLEFGFLW